MNKDIVERGDIVFVDPRENSVYAEKKYVEVNEAIKTILNASPTRVWDALQVLAEMKGAGVAPIVHAHWERKAYFPDGTPAWVCSRCGHPEEVKYSHCNCGARMDEEVTADED